MLLGLKQTALSTDRKRALHLGDTTSLIDLGTFADCLNGHDLSKTLDFELGWSLPKSMDVKDPLDNTQRFMGNQINLAVSLSAGKTGQPEVTSLKYELSNGDRNILDPAEVMGTDYPSETFRVLKSGEIRDFGEYRTQRLVLAAWDTQTRER
ncbi:MAG: hypothetical protein ORN29_07850 [Rhodoferax sp.]|nr:hypothetical protein [Rhodoferax sp.]